MRRYGISMGLLLATLGLAWAQEPPKSCEQQLSEVQIERELLERDAKQARQQAAVDLARWIARTQGAEKRAAQAQLPAAEPKPEGK